tara:strand:+ start:1131 stop:1976 length:846 start_codon:yes stop_codon:yes gene_type:complete
MIPKIIFTMVLIATISTMPAFAASSSIEVGGLMKVNHALNYDTTGINLKSVTADLDSISLIFEVSVLECSAHSIENDLCDPIYDMTVAFDRTIFDAKIAGEDDEFFIIADAEEITFEEEKNDTTRTLSFSLSPGTEEFEIFGTILFDESFLLKLEEMEKAKALKEEEERKYFYEVLQPELDAAAERINERIQAEQAEKAAKEAEAARIALLMEACGDGTIYVDGECVNEGLVGPQPEPVDSGPLINSIFAAMGIGLAVMIILWGIGRSRHKKLSVSELDNS